MGVPKIKQFVISNEVRERNLLHATLNNHHNFNNKLWVYMGTLKILVPDSCILSLLPYNIQNPLRINKKKPGIAGLLSSKHNQ
jgi:hypothetical protein